MKDGGIRCLGTVEAWAGELSADLAGERTRHLLAALVASPTGLSTDELLEELWADRQPDSRGAAARMAVKRLRGVIGGDAVQHIAGRYRLAFDRSQVDVWSFEDAGVDDDPSGSLRALRLWRGRPFAGVEPTPRLRAAADRLDVLRCAHARNVATAIAAGSGTVEGLELVVGVADEHLLDEGLVVETMGALDRAGRPKAALDLCRRHRVAMVEQLGIEPTPVVAERELEILRRGLDNGRAGVRVDLDTLEFLARATPSVPLVGRSPTLDQLDDAWAGAQVDGALVLIEAAAGTGKSTVAAAFSQRLVEDGVGVRAGRCTDEDAMLYEPFVRAFPELEADLHRAYEHPDPSIGRLQFWRQVEEFLVSACHSSPLAVIVDDLHQAGAETAALLRHLTTGRRLPAGLLVVATARHHDESPGWTAARDAIRSAATKVPLHPLGLEALVALVDHTHPEEPPLVRRRFAAELAELSGGNPLVATHLCRGPIAGLASAPPSTDAAAILGAQTTAAVGEATSNLLACAAMVGIEFNIEVAADLHGVSAEQALRLLRRARDAHVCIEVAHDTFRFGHALLAQPFRDLLTESERRRYAAQLTTDERLAPHVRARYVQDAGTLVPADVGVPLLIDAGDALVARNSFLEAARRFEAALLRNETDELTFAILVRLAAAHYRAGDVDASARIRGQALDAACNDDERCRAAMAGLEGGEFVGGEPDRMAIFERIDMSALVNVDPEQVWATWIRQARQHGEPARALDLAQRWDEASDRPPSAHVDLQRLLIAQTSALPEPTRARLATLATTIPAGPQRSEIRRNELLAALIEQRADAAHQLFDEVEADVDRFGSPRSVWALAAIECALTTAQMRPVQKTPGHALEVGLRLGVPDTWDGFAVQTWMEMWRTGDLGQAASLIEDNRDDIAMNSAWFAGLALGHLETGEPALARSAVGEALEQMKSNDNDVWRPVTAALLAEVSRGLGDAVLAAEAAEALTSRSGQSLVLGMGVAHFGPCDRYLGLAHLVMGDHARGADHLERAGEQARQIGSLRWQRAVARDLEQAS